MSGWVCGGRLDQDLRLKRQIRPWATVGSSWGGSLSVFPADAVNPVDKMNIL